MTHAATGVVLYFPSGCDFFVVESDAGMALMSVTGNESPMEGDVLVGDFEAHGPVTLKNFQTGRSFAVNVEDYWLSEDAAIDRYLNFCELPPAL